MSRSRLALLGAAACAVLIAVGYALAFHSAAVHHADAAVLAGFEGLQRPHLHRPASFIAHLADPAPYVVIGIVLALVALLRGRWRSAAAIVAVLILAPVCTEALKPILGHARASGMLSEQVGADSFPSGHATASMSLVLAAVLAMPARWRALTATLGTLYTLAVCYALLSLAWHYPSDVLAGYLMAGFWMLLAVSVLLWAQVRWPQRAARGPGRRALRLREALRPPLAAGLCVLGVAALIVLDRPHGVAAYLHDHHAFVAGAAAIAVLGIALATALTLAMRGGENGRRGRPSPH